MPKQPLRRHRQSGLPDDTTVVAKFFFQAVTHLRLPLGSVSADSHLTLKQVS